jgi:hypothetical protein
LPGIHPGVDYKATTWKLASQSVNVDSIAKREKVSADIGTQSPLKK